MLASASPRRAALLQQLGLPFRTLVTGVDEALPTGVPIEGAVRSVARRKLQAAIARTDPARAPFLVAADTVVVYAEQVIGKPRDPSDAVRILETLAEREHQVLTAIAVAGPDRRVHESVTWTVVRLGALTRDQIEAYVATGEPMDKAGAYAIQGQGGAFVESIEGDYSNVVGLPMRPLLGLLGRAGYPLPPHLRVS